MLWISILILPFVGKDTESVTAEQGQQAGFPSLVHAIIRPSSKLSKVTGRRGHAASSFLYLSVWVYYPQKEAASPIPCPQEPKGLYFI